MSNVQVSACDCLSRTISLDHSALLRIISAPSCLFALISLHFIHLDGDIPTAANWPNTILSSDVGLALGSPQSLVRLVDKLAARVENKVVQPDDCR